MSKKIILLALAAISAAVFALPAAASAEDIPLHLNPTPEGNQPITGGVSKLSDTSGLTVTCNEVKGNATFEAGGTTGHMELTFTGDCRENVFSSTCTTSGQSSGTITTTELPFHLLTLPNKKPGVLVTPNASGAFAHFECAGGLVKTTVEGNGVIGTIENTCGETSKEAKIKFVATADGVQEHTLVEGTSTVYRLTRAGNNAAQEATGIVKFTNEPELVCT